MDNIENIAVKARKAISSFCHEECRSYCCRKGFLLMDNSEAKTFTSDRVKEFMDTGLLKRMIDGRLSYNISADEKPCPNLNGFRCMIHSNPNRPRACRQFPVFISRNTVMLSGRCLAVKEGKFYPFIAQWMMIGCKIIVSDQFSNSDFYNLTIDSPKAPKQNI